MKLQEDFFSSPKIKKLRRIAGGDTYTVIYMKMQLLSIKSGGVIEYQGIEQTFAEELALVLDEDAENVEVTLSFLTSQGLIEQSDDKSFLLTQAAENIGSESESASRVRAFRSKTTAKALQCNNNVTPCNNLLTLDKEKDKDRDKENTDSEKKKARAFIPPTVQEVKAYCAERKNKIDAERFVDHYKSNGWMVGRNKMKDWKAAVRTWEKGEKEVKKDEKWLD